MSPIVVMALAWPLLGETPYPVALAGGVVGLAGVGLLVLRAGFAVDPVGVAASWGAVGLSAVGYVLVKRWTPPTDLLTFTSWQLVAGGLFLLPLAALEGPVPRLDAGAVGGLTYLAVLGTGVAYVAWVHGLRRLPAGAGSLLGLVNPVVGTLLGVALAGEAFGPAQLAGMVLVLTGVLAGQPALRSGPASVLARRGRAVPDQAPAPVTAGERLSRP